MKRIYLIGVALCLSLVVNAQSLVPISWTAYGLVFDAPRGIRIEEDTEDTFLLNNKRFYITLQTLDSDEITREELNALLIGLAKDDGVEGLSSVVDYDLPQFQGIYVKGTSGEDSCYYVCLITKDAGSMFLITILYNRTEEQSVDKILKSFKMEE
ncbi:MAG: hypothetical protein E7096_06880 [Bacteroides sp.]|nr:hypothetical protein [Bacteroides sp.]